MESHNCYLVLTGTFYQLKSKLLATLGFIFIIPSKVMLQQSYVPAFETRPVRISFGTLDYTDWGFRVFPQPQPMRV